MRYAILISNSLSSISTHSTPPEPVKALAVFPHLDGSILGARGIEVAVRGEGDRPDRSMVALMNIYSLSVYKIHKSKSS